MVDNECIHPPDAIVRYLGLQKSWAICGMCGQRVPADDGPGFLDEGGGEAEVTSS